MNVAATSGHDRDREPESGAIADAVLDGLGAERSDHGADVFGHIVAGPVTLRTIVARDEFLHRLSRAVAVRAAARGGDHGDHRADADTYGADSNLGPDYDARLRLLRRSAVLHATDPRLALRALRRARLGAAVAGRRAGVAAAARTVTA